MSNNILTIQDILSADDADIFDDVFDCFDDDNDQYSEADFAAASAACKVIPDQDIRKMLARGETVKSILAGDRAAFREMNEITKEVNRDFREAWEQQHDGYDIVDVAHEQGVALSEFDQIAARLGMGKNWSDRAQQRRNYKDKNRARRIKNDEYKKSAKYQKVETEKTETQTETQTPKSTLIVTPTIKKIIAPAPRKIKVKKLVTIDNLAALEKRLSKIPASRPRPGQPRIWSQAGAVRW